jgi:glycosyltransferase involved in cell wall biosynthesis
LLRLNRAALRRAKVIIATSRAIERQVRTLTDAAVILHLPTWEPEQFAGIAKPVWSRPFRIIFAARIEENKGIFDVLEIARRCPEFQFDVCGDGGALEKARKLAPPNVTFLGFCDRRRLQAAVSQAHVALVPTRADCEAGFEMTCAEAILSGRPLITSAVCPALEYLRPAALEVEPENIDQYVDALRVISGDRELYERLCGACEPLRAQFFDPANSWLTAAQKALNRLGLGSSSE